ncbi:collagen-binding domain-containing protein [uncultured Fibrobacter sp.]|uniref:collagen-binding domain-containing protein n=1 Tax=uncultured Fibrobacter sp. TaxID=261512 RepID=UPI00344CA573
MQRRKEHPDAGSRRRPGRELNPNANGIHVQTDFAGTIVAPNAEVVVGQAGKNFYGSIFAKSIVVHQYTKVTWVPFIPVQMNGVVAHIDNHEPLRYSVVF